MTSQDGGDHARDDATAESIVLSLRWSGAATVGLRVVSMARSLLLARIVGPHAFGVFAGVLPFTTFGGIVAELGLGSYLVHRSSHARDESGGIVWLVLALGITASFLLAGLALPVALLYRESVVRAVVVVLAPVVAVSALTAVPRGVLQAEMRFRAIGVSQVIGEVVGLSIGLAVALRGGGVWALVAATLTSQAVTLVALWSVSGIHRPLLHDLGEMRRNRQPLRYGSLVAAAAVVWAVSLYGDNVIVGRSMGLRALGLYAFAYGYGVLPGTMIGATVGQVAFPVFAHSRKDQHVLRDQFIRFTRLIATIELPLVGIAFVLAGPAVKTLLGARWMGAVGPLRLILLMGALRGLYPTDEVLLAVGKVGVQVRIGLVAAPALLAAAAIGAGWGLTGVAAGVVMVFAGSIVANTLIVARLIGLPWRRLAQVPGPLVAAAAGAAIAALAVSRLGSIAAGIRLWVAIASGLVLYLGALRGWLPNEWIELRSLVDSKHRVLRLG
jgi:PST family polysaccharide transporter